MSQKTNSVLESMSLDHTKSSTDLKQYRLITLTNGLKALLVSTRNLLPADQQEDASKMKAAAAMAVQVGSYSDPEFAGINSLDFSSFP